ncbi:MAG: TIGR02757 family protein [Alphaproteobacteria bacterium]|nr:TIGR02757 family protein [Alphaproteobacteria bacterium]
MDHAARRAADPVRFAHRYERREDQEVAAVIAACFAYGRVAGFTPVLERIFDAADGRGGPRRWVDGFDPETDAATLSPLVYRWNRGVDVSLLALALKDLLAGRASLEEHLPADGELSDALDALILAVREAAVRSAASLDLTATSFEQLPRGFRSFLPRPADGSATKRWWMFLRWMIRPATEGVDLGLWTSRRPSELLVPVDTHVLRLSRFLGLTTRTDGSLRTARQITASLRAIDPVDPVRFDFALAHLGISGACKGRRDDEVCPACPLHGPCAVR